MSNKPVGSARDRAYQGIRTSILDLTLQPGTLLSENEIAANFGISRTPVREALVLLAKEGLVQVAPKTGTFVARVDLAEVIEAQFFREAVEMASLASLTPPFDDTAMQQLRDNLRQQNGVGDDWHAFFRLDETFHSLLMELAGHGASWKFVAAAKGHLDRARWLGLATLHESTAVRIGEHHAIFDAVENDQLDDASILLRQHLRNVFADIETIKASSPDLFVTDASARPARRSVAVWT